MSSKYFDGQFDNVSFDSQFAGEELRFLDACIDCDDDSLYEIIQNGITWEEVNERDKSGRVSLYLTILTLGRPGGGLMQPPPLAFFPCNFFMIPIAKIASAYLLLGMGDTFWHMWHHLDAVTWHMSWRHNMYMTEVKIHSFYHSLLIEISFDVDAIK